MVDDGLAGGQTGEVNNVGFHCCGGGVCVNGEQRADGPVFCPDY